MRVVGYVDRVCAVCSEGGRKVLHEVVESEDAVVIRCRKCKLRYKEK